jgi:hypothetical protein
MKRTLSIEEDQVCLEVLLNGKQKKIKFSRLGVDRRGGLLLEADSDEEDESSHEDKNKPSKYQSTNSFAP